jgi:hypothetical protein
VKHGFLQGATNALHVKMSVVIAFEGKHGLAYEGQRGPKRNTTSKELEPSIAPVSIIYGPSSHGVSIME